MTNPTPQTLPELLPCPFCGGEPEHEEHTDESLWSHNTVPWRSVRCSTCEIGTRSICEGARPNECEAWNARAIDSGDQLLGMYAIQADEIKALLDKHAPSSTGNIRDRIAQILLAAQPPAVAAIPEPSEGDVDLLLAEIDRIAEDHFPGYGLPTHAPAALQSMRAQVLWFFGLWIAPATAGEATAAQGAGWQPRKTAPTNRPILLLWRTVPLPLRGSWQIDEDFASRPKGWVSPEAGWRNDGDQCIPVNQEDFTHWMELPAAPSPAAPGNGEGGK